MGLHVMLAIALLIFRYWYMDGGGVVDPPFLTEQ